MSRRDRAVLRACIDFSRLGRASNRQSDGKREREREREFRVEAYRWSIT